MNCKVTRNKLLCPPMFRPPSSPAFAVCVNPLRQVFPAHVADVSPLRPTMAAAAAPPPRSSQQQQQLQQQQQQQQQQHQAPVPAARVSRAVVWLRDGDLRLHDHPGLSTATELTMTALAVLLVVTPSTRPETLQAAIRLRAELAARGSALFMRAAADEPAAVVSFVEAFAAERVHVRADVEAEARAVVAAVAAALPPSVALDAWSAATADLRDWTAAPPPSRPPRDFPAFRAWRGARRRPPPSDILDVPPRIVPSPGPLSPELVSDSAVTPAEALDAATKAAAAATVDAAAADIGAPLPPAHLPPHWEARFEPRASAERELTRARSFSSEAPEFGERALLDFLAAAERDALPDLARSLGEVFRQGALSPRRMHELTVQFERANGRLWSPVYREAAKLVLGLLDAREFSTLLARDDLSSGTTVDGAHAPRFWRWNGFLVRYVEEGAESAWAQQDKPPVLLVHGFGASSQHFGKSVALLKEKFHVFAIDLIGFGQSEKPPMQYTPAVWENVVWDFVREVVKRPVYVAGNSIGGYISCAFGVDAFPSLCVGICLINSAGRLYEPTAEESKPPKGPLGLARYAVHRWRWVRMLAARALLKQLQGRVDTTLQKVYPKRGIDVNGELAREIRRAALDYGAVEVLCSGLITPQPRSIARLLEGYDGPLLVFNGLLDPLGDVPTRTDRLAELYPAATVVRVDAGHCPHDEEPEIFAEAISDWVMKSESEREGISSVGSNEVAPLATSQSE